MKWLFAMNIVLFSSVAFAYSAFYPEIPSRALRNRNHLKMFFDVKDAKLAIHYPDGTGKPTIAAVLGVEGTPAGCYRSFRFRAPNALLVQRDGVEAGVSLMPRDYKTLAIVIGPILDPNNVILCVNEKGVHYD